MNEWKEVKLGEVCKYVSDRISNQKLDANNYISTENMLPGKCGITTSSGLPTTSVIEYMSGDILVSNIRPYFKKIWYADRNGGCSTDVLNFRSNSKYNSKFLYYVLSDDNFFEYSMSTSKGTKMPRGDKTALMNYTVPLPSLPEQKAIADTLSCLDDKIELNNKINKNLEAQAQAIFKSWFVDFEPFQDGEFVDSELGRIPKGWRVGTLGQVAKEIICGKTPSTKVSGNFGGDIPFITIPDMHNKVYITKTERYLTDLGISTQKNKLLPENAICVSCIATAGLVSLTSEISQTNQQINSVVCKDDTSVFYMYLTLCNLSEHINTLGSSGSTTKNLNKEQFSKIKIIVSQCEFQYKFNELILPFFEKIKQNQQQIQTLTALRDTLLPKLMSGEVRVPMESGVY